MAKEICKCRHITKADLKRAVKNGAGSFQEVRQETKVGKACGKCKKKAKRYVRSCLKKAQGR